jgi:hypothetical protein
MFNEGNQIHNFMSSSGSGTVIYYCSGSDFLTSYGSGSGSTSQKVTVPTVPVPVPQHWWQVLRKNPFSIGLVRLGTLTDPGRFPTGHATPPYRRRPGICGTYLPLLPGNLWYLLCLTGNEEYRVYGWLPGKGRELDSG